jgi:hypothetical protein
VWLSSAGQAVSAALAGERNIQLAAKANKALRVNERVNGILGLLEKKGNRCLNKG